MNPRVLRETPAAAILAGFLCLWPSAVLAAAQITILNTNAAGVGFNDPTAATPVGGNTGTTVGEQRLIAFQHAADIWGALLAAASRSASRRASSLSPATRTRPCS